MFITPMTRIDGIQTPNFGSVSKDYGEAQVPFKDVFQTAIKEVTETDRQVSEDVTALATGQSDDLHNLEIDITKAQLSLNMMIQLRNKAMDSYTEIMRMSL